MIRIFFVMLFLTSFSIVAQTKISKNLGDYSEVKIYNGITVELIKSDKQYLEITGKKSEKVKIKNVDNTLKISLKFSVKPSENAAGDEVLVKLYYNKEIAIIDANEGATITSKNFAQDNLEVNAQERAFINLTCNVKYLNIRTSSGGIVKLSGTAENQVVAVDLYGIYHGFGMKVTGNSTVNAGTGAKAEVLAGETLNAKVGFGGSIFYKGNPKVIKDKKVIGGVIQKRN